MKPMKGYYSIIHFCPDRAKLEVANVGVVLFVQEIDFLDIKVSHNNARIHHFFGQQSFDVKHLKFLKDSIENRIKLTEKNNIKTLDALEKFINTRANDLVLTNPRPIKVDNPQTELENLFDELVGERAKHQKSKALFPELDNIFRNRLRNKMIFDQTVEIPGMVGLKKTLNIPYAYQNGKLNLIHPREFGPQGLDTGFQLAAEGQLIQKNPINGIKRDLIVLPKIENISNYQDMRSSLSRIFNDLEIRTIWEEQIEEFAQEVEQAH